ncbi:MAG: DNA-binding response regulator [Robiginitomaculum sp.]|nr:MAG: DNA-binding response regulator [Robiginitomaculum sp.]
MNILIVEDEPRAVDRLKALFTSIAPESHIVGVTTSIRATIEWINIHDAPDIIMMDIHLADGNCFSIFDVCQITAPIIFCTAYDEYALKAFQSNGIAYLLKPVVEADLRGALNKLEQLRQSLSAKDISLRRKLLRHMGANQDGYKSRFLIRAGGKIIPVLTKDIACFVSEQHGLKVWFFDGGSYFVDYTLVELTGVLNPDDFFQISRQAIIAIKVVTSVSTRARNTRVQMDALKRELSVTRNRAKAFRKWLER